MIIELIKSIEGIIFIILGIGILCLIMIAYFRLTLTSDLIDDFLIDAKNQMSDKNFPLPKKIYYAPKNEYGEVIRFMGLCTHGLFTTLNETNDSKNIKYDIGIFYIRNYIVVLLDIIFSFMKTTQKTVFIITEMTANNEYQLKFGQGELFIEQPYYTCTTKKFICHFTNKKIFWSWIDSLFQNKRLINSFNTANKSELIADMKFTTLDGIEIEMEEQSIFKK